MPIETLVVSLSPAGQPDRLGSALLRALPGEAYAIFERETILPPAAPELLPPFGIAGMPSIMVVSVSDDGPGPDVSPATLDAVSRAAAACVRLAAANGQSSIAMPLLGAGAAGLDSAVVADALVASVRFALADAHVVRDVVFVVENSDDAAVVEAAWSGYRSQPFANDRPEGPDLLGIRDEVSALADMLLLRDVQPPLAVGVLGGWGSGKSFVMHLMRERMNEVRATTLTEAECWEGDRVSPFVGHVYPIEFNAWTYARADLWAALMQTALSELDRQLGLERRLAAKNELLNGALWKELCETPAALHALYSATDFQAGTGADLFATLNAVHADDRAELAIKQAHLADLREKEAAAERAVETTVAEKETVEIEAARWAPFRKLVGDVVGAAEDEVQQWVKRAAPEATNDAEQITQDGRALVAALRTLLPPDHRVGLTVAKRHFFALAVVLAVTFGAPFALSALHGQMETLTVSAGVVAGVTSFARLAREWVAVGRRFAEQAAAWQRSVEEDVRRIEAARASKVEASKSADPTLAQVRADIARAEHDVEHLKQRAGLIGEFRSVADLVSARLSAGTYVERLGVMQQISDDLVSISRSLTMAAKEIDEHRASKLALFPRGPARVVLFIDDLDRCPPEKVVEVLEAVQLLLATNLFVVVIALDVRYITKALEKVYEGVLDADGEPSGVDYLEKIIQVPYRTRTLTTDAARRFLHGQLRVAPTPGPQSPGAAYPGRGTARGDDVPQEPVAERSAASVARDLLFQPDDVEVLATCCTVLALSPRAGKRVGNVTKLFRMVWARRGRSAPTLDETATVALLVGLAAAHPEIQRDALAFLAARARVATPASGTVAQTLTELPAPAGAGGQYTQYIRWRAALELATSTRVLEGDHDEFRLGAAPLADVAKVVEFVTAFCFVADVAAPR